MDVGSRDVGVNHRAQIAGVLLDANIDGKYLMAGAVEKERVRLAGLLRQKEYAPRRAYNGIDNFRI